MEFETRLAAALADEQYTVGSNTLAFGGRIADIIETILGQIELPPKESVIGVTRTLLQKLFAATDIPNVPEPIEVLIEGMVANAIIAIVDRTYDRLARE